jgi:hypothetical protein
MYQAHYSDSLHHRLDGQMYSGGDYASSSTARSSFSQPPPQTQQRDVSILSSNPWGAPDMFATDPKLAAFYSDAAAAAIGAGLTTGVDGLIHNTFDFTGDSNLLGELSVDPATAIGLHQFSPEDLEAILASGILDNNTQPAATADGVGGGSLSSILHPRSSQARLYLPNTPQIQINQQYDDAYVYSQLTQERLPSISSIMGIAPSPPSFLSAAPSPQDYNVVRGDSNVIVHSPAGMEAAEAAISIGSPQASYEPPQTQASTTHAVDDTRMDTSEDQAATAVSTASKAPTNRYSLADFVFHHTLGTGSFGRVHLGALPNVLLPYLNLSYSFVVQSKHNMRFYAIKVLAKEKVVRLKQVEHTNSERALLGLCKHPFLVNLWGTFQDQHNLFMVMDFVAGGELFTLIRKSVRFPSTVAKFYAAEVATAIEYLHQIDIIYRDLKPENILIGQDGHVKLTDFGFAKRVRSMEQTYTMCGTPDYLAPEIILSQGYTQSVDWYAWGVLIFEMLAG